MPNARSAPEKTDVRHDSETEPGVLRDRRNGRRGDSSRSRGGLGGINIDLLVEVHLSAVGVLLGAVAGDVTGFTTLVAGLASSVQGATVGSGAVARDVAELPAGVALHRLCLAVAGKVVGAAALVAGGARATGESATAAVATVTTAADGTTAAHSDSGGVRASALSNPLALSHVDLDAVSRLKVRGETYGEMTRLAAVVATATCAGTAQAESRAVGLDVAEALAVVALLRLGATRERAAIGFVAGLLAYFTG